VRVRRRGRRRRRLTGVRRRRRGRGRRRRRMWTVARRTMCQRSVHLRRRLEHLTAPSTRD
jgi:hypothetical protein